MAARRRPLRVAIEARAFEYDSPRNTGIGNYLAGLVQALGATARGTRSTVLTVGPVDDDIIRLVSTANVRLRRVHLPMRVVHRLRLHRRLPLLAALAPRADVFVFTNFATYPLGRTPYALVVYDLSFLVVPETLDAGYRELLTRTVPVAIERAAAVIVLSEAVKHELIERCATPPEKIAVAPPGVDRTRFRPVTDDEAAAVRARLGLPDRYLLFVGTLQPRKNLVRLLAAYRALPPEVRAREALVLVGMKGWQDDDILDALDDACAAGERIHRAGYVASADLPALYSGATAFVWPALYEGFGMPILEAMACGTPVITSNRSAMPEAAGGAALLVDPTDVDALSAAMQRLADDGALARELVERGLERAARADWRDTADAVLDALEAAVDGPTTATA